MTKNTQNKKRVLFRQHRNQEIQVKRNIPQKFINDFRLISRSSFSICCCFKHTGSACLCSLWLPGFCFSEREHATGRDCGEGRAVESEGQPGLLAAVPALPTRGVPRGPTKPQRFVKALVVACGAQACVWQPEIRKGFFGWLAGWLTGWLTGWLAGWVAGWATRWLPGRLAGRLGWAGLGKLAGVPQDNYKTTTRQLTRQATRQLVFVGRRVHSRKQR